MYYAHRINIYVMLLVPYRAKHPVKVHIWGGISKKGQTDICVFEGIMDRFLFTEILEKTLVPSLKSSIPPITGSCRIMIQSIRHFMPKTLSWTNESIGGKLQPSHQI